MWCGVVWCGVVWCGVVWCGVVWCGVVWCGVVWCGVVWCGVVWFGVVWCGVVWFGVVWQQNLDRAYWKARHAAWAAWNVTPDLPHSQMPIVAAGHNVAPRLCLTHFDVMQPQRDGRDGVLVALETPCAPGIRVPQLEGPGERGARLWVVPLRLELSGWPDGQCGRTTSWQYVLWALDVWRCVAPCGWWRWSIAGCALMRHTRTTPAGAHCGKGVSTCSHKAY